jgi:hypothetical protein
LKISYFLCLLSLYANSDLVETLRVLTAIEQEALQKFMDNPSKVRKECVELTRYLLACLQEEDWTRMERKLVYASLFPKKEWVENKLAKLMGETLAHVRSFVAENTAISKMNELQQQLYLQIFYQERGLEDKFWATYKYISSTKTDLKWQTTQDRYTRFYV